VGKTEEMNGKIISKRSIRDGRSRGKWNGGDDLKVWTRLYGFDERVSNTLQLEGGGGTGRNQNEKKWGKWKGTGGVSGRGSK